MRPEEELIRQDKAFRNPVVPTSAPAPSTVTKDTALKAAMDQKAEALNNKFPWKGDTPAVTVPASGSTGFETSDGVPIESSFRYADDFYNQIGINNILDNTPSGAMSYQGYLAYNGITDPRMTYRRNLDAAQEMYARAIGTYGASGEGLAQGNLANAGYSEYLTGLAYQQKVANTMQAQSQLRQDLAQTAMQYQQYLRDYEKSNGISVPGDEGDSSGTASVEGGTTVLTPTQQAAYDYIRANVQTPADLPAAIIEMRSQGLTDEDIEAGLNNWKAWYAEKINEGIDGTSSLAAGNAAQLKEAYGEGEEYDSAVERLQQRNDVIINAAIESIISGDLESEDFVNATKALRENTAYEDKKGNTLYTWDDMNDGDKLRAFKDALTDMYKQGDISQKTYQAANYRLIDDSLNTDLGRSYVINAGKKHLRDILEDVAIMDAEPGSVSPEQRESILKKAADSINASKLNTVTRGARGYTYDDSTLTITVNGKNMNVPAHSGQVTETKVDSRNGTRTAKTAEFKEADRTDKSGLYAEGDMIYYGQDGIRYTVTIPDLTEPQYKALAEIISAKG